MAAKHKIPDYQPQPVATHPAHRHRVLAQEPLISLRDTRPPLTLPHLIHHITHCLLRLVQVIDGLIRGIQAPLVQPQVTSHHHHHHTRAHTPEVLLRGNLHIQSPP